MTNKLTLSDDIKPFFDTDDKQIWNLIIENSIDELLALLPREEAEDKTLDTVIKELLSEGESKRLDEHDFLTIKESNGVLIRNLVRLVFTLDMNGNYENIRESVVNKLFDIFPVIVEKIQKETFGYPARMIDQYILTESATIRAALMNLVYYYKQKEDLDSLHSVTTMRTTITLAIMSNYKNVIGHDMIETAKVKEQVGEREAALTFYNAARENLKNELHWFVESPEMGPNEDDVVMLQALKDAYIAIDRLNNTSEYVETCALIDEILSREYVEFDFDDEDDDE